MSLSLLSKFKKRTQRLNHRPRVELLERRDLLASYTTPEDTALVVSDPELVGFVVVKRPEHGTVSPTNVGGFVYLPAKDYHGADRFTYALVTSTTLANVPGEVQEVTITVTPVNDPPVAFPDEFSTLKNKPLAVAAPGVLKNDKDVDNTELKAVLVAQAAHGVVELAENGSFKYTPAENYSGPDSFIYRASDGIATSNETKVFLHVRSLPDARDDQYSVSQNGVLNVPPRGVLANDVGIEHHGLIASLEPGDENRPKHGTVTVNADGSFSYKPDPNYFGPDSFVYRATDNTPVLSPSDSTTSPLPAAYDLAKVHLYVRPNPIVRANPDVFETAVNKTLSILPPGVLKNDYVLYADPTTGANTTASGILPPNAPLFAKLITPPASGELVLRENGSFEYVPKKDFAGTVTFTYQAKLPATIAGTPLPASSDTNAQPLDVATVTIHVKAQEPPPGPIARNDEYSTLQDTPLDMKAPGVLGNDAGGSEEHPLEAVLVSQPLHGKLELAENGAFLYTPDPNYTGTDLFVYRAETDLAVTDPPTTNTAATNTNPGDRPIIEQPGNVAIVRIHVRAAQSSVKAYPDKYATPQNVPLVVVKPGVLVNDYALVNHRVEASLAEGPAHGTVTVNADGSFTYTPVENFVGEDKFVYKATDLDATGSNTAGTTNVSFATVVIRVHAELAPPKFIPGGNQRTTDESGQQRVADWATLLSLTGDGQPSFIVSTDRPQLFASPPTIDATGQLSYTPAPNVEGTAQVTVALNGDTAAGAATTFTIEIDKPHPLFNAANSCDVTDDQNVLASDALAVINHLNAFGATSVAEGEPGASLYLDVSQDNVISAFDALLVINALNAGLGDSGDTAEGESAAAAADLSLLALMGESFGGSRRKRT